MQVFTPTLPELTQPLIRGLPTFKRQPVTLLDQTTRWRKQADLVHLSPPARLRLEWMVFYETAGNHDAYATASHFGITPKTFYKWWRRFDGGKVSKLEEQSRAPIRRRTWQVSPVEEARVKQLRSEHLHWGRKKLKVLYRKQYAEDISLWKIERVIRKHQLYPDQTKAHQVAARRKRARDKPKRRIQDLIIQPGLWFLLHLDGITIYWGNVKRYILTAVDHEGKFGYARMYTTKSSRSAKDFLYRLRYVINAPILNIQTDNGSEFYYEFEDALQAMATLHWFSRPRTPKDNPMVERFNETLEYEWLNDGHFTPNVSKFNQALTEWLVEYNFVRPHQALAYQTPVEYITQNAPRLLPMWSVSTSS